MLDVQPSSNWPWPRPNMILCVHWHTDIPVFSIQFQLQITFTCVVFTFLHMKTWRNCPKLLRLIPCQQSVMQYKNDKQNRQKIHKTLITKTISNSSKLLHYSTETTAIAIDSQKVIAWSVLVIWAMEHPCNTLTKRSTYSSTYSQKESAQSCDKISVLIVSQVRTLYVVQSSPIEQLSNLQQYIY